VKKRGFYYLFAALLCLAFFSLGRWQLSRAEWKQQRLDAVAKVLRDQKAEPLSYALSASENKITPPFVWSSGRGRFLQTPALLLDNQRRGAQVGVQAYRVFKTEQGAHVLVNLGWLAIPGNRTMPVIDTISGEQAVDGLVMAPPSPGLVLGPSHVKVDDNYWLMTRMDIGALSKDLNIPLASRVLRLNPKHPLGYARDLDILPNTLPPEKHRGYAVQWFGLGIAVFVITIVLTLRRKKL
jgi:surfeit locus 1 family protein